MPTLPFYVIPRITKDREAILFFPDCPANKNHILSYMHVGQHGEASMEYYRTTHRPRPDYRERYDIGRLLFEYVAKLDKTEHLEIVRRDSKKFQQVRWAGYFNPITTRKRK